MLWCMLRKLLTLQRMYKSKSDPILPGESLFFSFKVLSAHLKANKLKDFSLRKVRMINIKKKKKCTKSEKLQQIWGGERNMALLQKKTSEKANMFRKEKF